MIPRNWTLPLLLLAVMALPCAALDPALLKLLPPDSSVLGGINVEQARSTPFGQYVLKMAQAENPDLQKLMEATGFDPRRDVREILLAASPSASAKHPKGVVLVSGQFDGGRIFAAARTMGVPVTTFAGVDMVTGKEPQNGGLAFLSPTLAVAGLADEVKGVIERFKGSGEGPGAALAAKAAEWSNQADIWLVTAGSPADFARHAHAPEAAGPMKAVPLEAIEQSAAAIKFGPQVQVTVEAVARTDKDATALGDVVRFVAGLVQLNREKPEAAEFARLLDSMELKTEARTVRLGFSVPEEQVEKMFKPGRGGKPTPRTRATI